MTALSPMGRVPQRRPIPARVKPRRRPGPWLAFLAVLVVLAVVVWWKVLGAAHKNNNTTTANGCKPRIDQSVITMDPKKIKVRVYNSTDRLGLARQVADGLRKKHFTILASTNDPLRDTRQVPGVAEIRYGTAGQKQALLLSFYFPGVQLSQDTRTDAAVDLAVGQTFKKMATDAQVSAAKKAALVAPAPEGC